MVHGSIMDDVCCLKGPSRCSMYGGILGEIEVHLTTVTPKAVRIPITVEQYVHTIVKGCIHSLSKFAPPRRVPLMVHMKHGLDKATRTVLNSRAFPSLQNIDSRQVKQRGQLRLAEKQIHHRKCSLELPILRTLRAGPNELNASSQYLSTFYLGKCSLCCEMRPSVCHVCYSASSSKHQPHLLNRILFGVHVPSSAARVSRFHNSDWYPLDRGVLAQSHITTRPDSVMSETYLNQLFLLRARTSFSHPNSHRNTNSKSES